MAEDITVVEVLVPGPAGPIGAFASVEVEMLAPGASPTASVTGTAPNQVLHLGIPIDESYTDEQIAALKGGAPSGRDTLSELSDAIDGVAADLASLDGTKLDKAGGTLTGPLILSADPTLALQAATKQYVDQIVASQDAMVFKGVVDCSANPNYPAADRGWTYRVSVAGRIGGGSGLVVEAGDILLCLTDATASGTQAAVGANWSVIQTNIDGAVTLTGAQTLTNKTLTSPVITTPTGLAKGDVGLGNVDNTSDASKPVSTAQQTALNGKVGTSGGQTIAGDLILLATNAWRYLQIRADAGQRRRLAWNSGANARWTLEANDSAEAGALAGSDLEIRRYDDSGGDLGPAWQFVRATGDLVPGGDAGAALGRSDRRVGKAFLALADHADDAAAAIGGIEVGQLYRTGGAVKIRLA